MKPNEINVLIACEESQAECIAFRERGFNAYSCDLQPSRHGGHPEWHIRQDVTPLLQGGTQFTTEDGRNIELKRWHLIIAHPPCTSLCRVSSVQLLRHGVLDDERLKKMYEAREFFMLCMQAKARFVAVENPIPMKRAELPRPSCYVHPSWYGHKYTKKTLYWLKNLPVLMPRIFYPNPKCYTYRSRGKYRSRTFDGVARAIATQWGDYILDVYSRQPEK